MRKLIILLLMVSFTAMFIKAEEKDEPDYKCVFESIKDPKAKALFDALKKEDINKIKELFASGVDVNTVDNCKQTPLMKAATKPGNKELFDFILKSGGNVKAKDNFGSSALYLSACKDNVYAMEALIKAGADINEKNNGGNTQYMEHLFGAKKMHVNI